MGQQNTFDTICRNFRYDISIYRKIRNFDISKNSIYRNFRYDFQHYLYVVSYYRYIIIRIRTSINSPPRKNQDETDTCMVVCVQGVHGFGRGNHHDGVIVIASSATGRRAPSIPIAR